MAWAGFVLGLVLLAGTAASVVKTLLIPRDLRSFLGGVAARAVLGGYRLAARRVRDLRRREDILASGPVLFLLVLLAGWICCLWLAYALLLGPFTGSVPQALRLSGSSLFTLGFTIPAGAGPYGLVFTESLAGLVVIALQIAYLPTLYGAYNRRETLVTMLEALAGHPPWGPELLARQRLADSTGYLARLYERWTEWAADISESHTTYRTLTYFRSRHPENPWPLALLAVLDAAALQLALCPAAAPAEARPLLRVGYLTMRKLAATLDITVPADPSPEDPVALTRAGFDDALERLREAGWEFERSPDQAWAHFKGWRVNYERAAFGIAAHLDLVAAPWSGPRPGLGGRPGDGVVLAPVRPAHRVPRGVWHADGHAQIRDHGGAGQREGDPEPAAGP